MKIEFENSIRRLSFLLPSTGHQNCLDKSMRFIMCKLISDVTALMQKWLAFFLSFIIDEVVSA